MNEVLSSNPEVKSQFYWISALTDKRSQSEYIQYTHYMWYCQWSMFLIPRPGIGLGMRLVVSPHNPTVAAVAGISKALGNKHNVLTFTQSAFLYQSDRTKCKHTSGQHCLGFTSSTSLRIWRSVDGKQPVLLQVELPLYAMSRSFFANFLIQQKKVNLHYISHNQPTYSLQGDKQAEATVTCYLTL